MKNSLAKPGARWLVAVWCACLLAACSGDPEKTPEQAVKDTLRALEVAAEGRTLSGFMEHISEEYEDHQGYTWDDIQRLVQFEYIRNQNIHIFTDIQQLEVDGDIATVELNAAMASRASDLENKAGRLRADTHRFSIILRRDAPEVWKVESVSWQLGWE